jgi:hypothetical protein
MKPTKRPKAPFDLKVFLTKVNGGKTIAEYRDNDRIFGQGDAAPTDVLHESLLCSGMMRC